MSGLSLEHLADGAHDDEEIADPRGPLERLRAQRKHLETQQGTRTFDHPGYDGVKVTFHRLGVEDTGRILYEGTDTAVGRNLQLLVEAVTGIELLDGDDRIHLSDRFDQRLAELMGIETDPAAEMGVARQICLGTFGGHEQPMLNFAAQVYAWMGTLRRADEKELLGG